MGFVRRVGARNCTSHEVVVVYNSPSRDGRSFFLRFLCVFCVFAEGEAIFEKKNIDRERVAMRRYSDVLVQLQCGVRGSS